MLKVACSALSFVLPIVFLLRDAMHVPPKLSTAVVTFAIAILDIGCCMSVILHRFFAHRAFHVGRVFQFVLGMLGCLAFQNGPVWWASKHRRHHKHCDDDMDPHSWSKTSLWYAWWGWTLAPSEQKIDREYVTQYFEYPELILLDHLWFLIPTLTSMVAYSQYGFHFMVTHVSTPMFLCRMITLLFNCEYHPPHESSKTCKSVDSVRILSELVGESHHDDHHMHPRRLRRPGLDLPYWLIIAPLRTSCMISAHPDNRK